MANLPRGDSLRKATFGDALGRSILINPSISIPMPAGAAPAAPSPSTTGNGQGGPGQSNQGTKGHQGNRVNGKLAICGGLPAFSLHPEGWRAG